MYTKAKLWQIKVFLITIETMYKLYSEIRIDLLNSFPKSYRIVKDAEKMEDLLLNIKADLEHEEMVNHAKN